MKSRNILLGIFLVAASVFYGYYLLTKGTKLDIVYKNWDGPSYVLAAISMYDPQVAYDNNFIHSGDIRPDWSWLPAHFPLYPLMIRALSFIGYFPAMLAISVGFTLGSYLLMYELIKYLGITRHPLLVTIPFLFLSPRWFLTSHIGSTESMFMFFIILFLLFFAQKKHLYAAISLAFAQATRPHAIFFLAGVALVGLIELIRNRDLLSTFKKYAYYLLSPLVIFLIFVFFKLQTGNFWAFFDAISLTKNLQSIPFRTFSFPAANIETFWQEVNVYDYVLYLGACLFMFRKKLWQYGVISLTYFIPLIFLQHSDISRYAIPLLPFAFIAYSEIIEKKEFTWATLLMSPAILLYAINFMDHNHGG